MSVALAAILASSLSSLLGLFGGFGILAGRGAIMRWSKYLVSFAAGALLAAALFDLLPEAIHEFPDKLTPIFMWVFGGFLLFFLIEKFLLWHHHTHPHGLHEETPALARLMIVGDALHNAIDGLVIGASFLISPALGVTTAVAVFFHELPQELGDFSIMLHSGMKPSRVAFWNVMGALVSPIATGIALLVGGQTDALELPLLGIAAGSFLYIASADLVPQIHQERRFVPTLIQVAMLILGAAAIVAIGLVVHE